MKEPRRESQDQCGDSVRIGVWGTRGTRDSLIHVVYSRCAGKLRRSGRPHSSPILPLDEILTSQKEDRFTEDDARQFQLIVHALGCASVMNGPLRDIATKLASGHSVDLASLFPSTPENRKGLKAPSEPAGW
jgi:hypothetical protein